MRPKPVLPIEHRVVQEWKELAFWYERHLDQAMDAKVHSMWCAITNKPLLQLVRNHESHPLHQ